MDSFAFVAYASLATSRTLLQRLLDCLNFALESEDLLLVQTNKKNHLTDLHAENHEDQWDFTWYLQWTIYTSIPVWTLAIFTSSSRGIEFKDILPWNISQMITKTIPITRIVISYAMKRGILFWVYRKVIGNWDKMIRISQWMAIVEQVLASEEGNKSKRARLTVTAGDSSRKVNHLIKVIWDNKVHQVYQSHHNSLASPYDAR